MLRTLEANDEKDNKYDYEIQIKQDPALRLKLGNKKGLDDTLLPSELGEDHWAEINRHQY